ncbi:Transposon TX1 uncharacterized 149 kDa protein [Linum grandiflorum]
MNILSWNCRGAGRPLTNGHLRDLHRLVRPAVTFLMETKNTNQTMETKRLSLNFPHAFYVDPVGTAGGLALWWKEEATINIISYASNFVHVECNLGTPFHCTFVHAPNNPTERRVFWEAISALHRQNVPWVIMGDFNAIAFTYEKLGGTETSARDLEPFRNLIADNHLLDLGFQGSPYTWTNCQEGHNRIQSRLDRVLANSEWQNLYPNSTVFHERAIGSDHNPLRINLDFTMAEGPSPFRFDERWSSDAEGKEIIERIWDLQGSATYKLQICKEKLHKWAKAKLITKRQRETQIKRRLDEIEPIFHSSAIMEEERSLKGELQDLWHTDHLLWKQTAKENWHTQGDRNTAFFHAITKHKKQRSKIATIQTESGLWIRGRDTLRAHAKSFYADLFTSQPERPQARSFDCLPMLVTPAMNSSLTASVTDNEIRAAVFALGASQSPDPDGFGGHFFRRFWPIIGPQVCDEIKLFFQRKTMAESWNDTHLVLIPKIPIPTKMSQFRPISCCNFRYKIIAKIMTTRLQRWMPDLISEMQAAFTGGRLIQDNIIIVHEVLHTFKTRKTGRRRDMCLKLDMKKAYDMVDWDCLDITLQAFGFCSEWRDCISACIRSVRFDVLFNGTTTGAFSPTRGIRQGDPLSPFLFILLSNALSIIIEKRIGTNDIHGIRLSRKGPLLTHCLFADDTIIFGKASREEAEAITGIINEYGSMTGQQVNKDKSSIFFSANVPSDTRESILAATGFSTTNSHTSYLGIPTEWGRSRKETFGFLLDRLSAMAQSWKCRLLSHARKVTLIKSVLQAIPSYIMSLFILPTNLINKMNTMIRRFFWAGSPSKKSIHWTNATTLCMLRDEGGLGFRDLEDFNHALVAKQAWRILASPNALWVKVLKAKYFNKTDFLHANKGSRPSWIWSSLCKVRTVLDMGVFKTIGDGKDIRLNADPWIPAATHMRFPGHTGPFETVADWITHTSRQWDLQTIAMYCDATTTTRIRCIPIGPPDAPDAWKWKFTADGAYSVSSAYQALRVAFHGPDYQDHLNGDAKKWRWMWNLPLPPKLTLFLWRCSHNALATRDNLHRRHCSASARCPACSSREESLSHCLFACSHARPIWSHFLPNWNPPDARMDFLSWFTGLCWGDPSLSPVLITAICWNIWKARNEMAFRDATPTRATTILLIESDTHDWSSPSQQGHTTTPPPPTQPAHYNRSSNPPPRIPPLDIDCDGSFLNDSQKAAFGLLISEPDGKVIDGKAGTFYCSTPIVAEAYALKEAAVAGSLYARPCRILSDCLLLIKAINGPKHRWPWQCMAVLECIDLIKRGPNPPSFHFIPRAANSKADYIAKAARAGSLLPGWMCSFL